MAAIIGVTGFKHTGKSEVRKYLCDAYGFCWRPMADPVKQMLAAGFDLTEDELHGALKDEPCEKLLGATPRHCMETLYVQWGRMMVHDHLWFAQWRRKTLALAKPTVADDVRAPIAAEMIRSMGGRVLRIVRPGKVSSGTLSEDEMDGIYPDYTITNSGNIGDLRRATDVALRTLGMAR